MEVQLEPEKGANSQNGKEKNEYLEGAPRIMEKWPERWSWNYCLGFRRKKWGSV